MRVVTVGDKSRYQFFRSLVEGGNSSSSFKTEVLGQQSIEVVFEQEAGSDIPQCCSNKLPLHTSVLFPKEGTLFDCKLSINDRVLIFDEFPYRTEEEMNLIERIQENYSGICCIVLFRNNRKALDSDISSEEDAFKEALEYYKSRNFNVFLYEQGNPFDFLFWGSDQTLFPQKSNLLRLLADVKTDIEYTFELEYELSYISSVEGLVSNPAILNSFVEYKKSFDKKNVMNIYGKNALNYIMVQNHNKVLEFVKKIYFKYIGNICTWDFEKDCTMLMNNITNDFKQKLNKNASLVFRGTEENYLMFVNENQKSIISFKNTIIEFFKTDLCRLIDKYMKMRIKRLEELLDE